MKKHIYLIAGSLWIVLLITLSIFELPFLAESPLIATMKNINFKNVYRELWNDNSQVFHADKKALSFLTQLPGKTHSSLDGTTELNFDETAEKVIALMVENHPDSRAQMKGLHEASIIYEAIAEGGITRFLAIFHSSVENEKVGPVRSARPYFVDIAEEYHATYGHAGGSDIALNQVHNGKVLNAEALFYEGLGKYFYRDHNYYAPHNLYANLKEVNELREKKEWNKTITPRFIFTEGTIVGDEAATDVTVDFSRNPYKVEYKYDETSKTYTRYLAGNKHIDHNGEKTFNPSNILVQFTEYEPYDNYGRLKMRTTGTGDALLFTQGQILKGKWNKEREQYTKFTDLDGIEWKLTPGQTWIELIKPNTVSWTS